MSGRFGSVMPVARMRPRGRLASFPVFLGLALAGCAGSGGAPVPAASGCVVTGDVGPAEIQATLADCEYARGRFALLFGSEAAGIDVVLTDTMALSLSGATGRVQVSWYSSASGQAAGSAAARARGFLEEQVVLTHELLHMLFWVHAGDPTDMETDSQYGTRRPDWFDEGVAVWGEVDVPRLRRWEQLAALPDEGLDLRALAGQPHPTLARTDRWDGVTSTRIQYAMKCRTDDCVRLPGEIPAGMAVRERVHRDGTVVVDTVPESVVRPQGTVAESFYPLAYGLVRYLYERGGTEAIATVLRRFDGGWPSADSVFAGIPGLPSGVEAVQADWRRYVRTADPG